MARDSKLCLPPRQLLFLRSYCGINMAAIQFRRRPTLMCRSPTRPRWNLRLNIFSGTPQCTRVLIHTLRVNSITDRETFVNMYDAAAVLKEGPLDLGFDLSTGGLPHKREFARVVTAWKTAKAMAETELHTDAVARAHGVLITLLPCDWTSILVEFKRSMARIFRMIDCLSNRCLRALRKSWPTAPSRLSLCLMWSAYLKRSNKEKTNQLGSTIYNSIPGSLSRPSGGISVLSRREGLRMKYAVLINLWLLAQMRQPGRSIYKDFDRSLS